MVTVSLISSQPTLGEMTRSHRQQGRRQRQRQRHHHRWHRTNGTGSLCRWWSVWLCLVVVSAGAMMDYYSLLFLQVLRTTSFTTTDHLATYPDSARTSPRTPSLAPGKEDDPYDNGTQDENDVLLLDPNVSFSSLYLSSRQSHSNAHLLDDSSSSSTTQMLLVDWSILKQGVASAADQYEATTDHHHGNSSSSSSSSSSLKLWWEQTMWDTVSYLWPGDDDDDAFQQRSNDDDDDNNNDDDDDQTDRDAEQAREHTTVSKQIQDPTKPSLFSSLASGFPGWNRLFSPRRPPQDDRRDEASSSLSSSSATQRYFPTQQNQAQVQAERQQQAQSLPDLLAMARTIPACANHSGSEHFLQLVLSGVGGRDDWKTKVVGASPGLLESICQQLPTKEQVVARYGPQPVIVGMETCPVYRALIRGSSASHWIKPKNGNYTTIENNSSINQNDYTPMPRVAGLYHTGTNALARSLQHNIQKLKTKDRLYSPYDVPVRVKCSSSPAIMLQLPQRCFSPFLVSCCVRHIWCGYDSGENICRPRHCASPTKLHSTTRMIPIGSYRL